VEPVGSGLEWLVERRGLRMTALRPQLSLFDAVGTSLAAILGAGIFSVIAAAGIALHFQ